MRRLRRMAVGALCVIASMLPLQFLGATTAAQAGTSCWTPLNLANGWSLSISPDTYIPAVCNISGIVHFEGAIKHGAGPAGSPFTLPAGFRPATNVYVPVDLCKPFGVGPTNGRLVIRPTGVVTIEAEGGKFANAECFTSLDGASFVTSASSFTPLTLKNGWTNAPYGTSNAAVRNINGIVHFKGAIATTQNNMVPFTLPAGFRPATNVYVPVDLCNATNGRLFIQPSGVVRVQAEGGNLANAECFTSLDGASFATSASSFTPLTLQNGWTNAPYGTSSAAVRNINGIVHFKGAIAHVPGPVNDPVFILPAGFRPAQGHEVHVKVDLCNATNGKLVIYPDGFAIVEAEGGQFANAECFTALDGASFALSGWQP